MARTLFRLYFEVKLNLSHEIAFTEPSLELYSSPLSPSSLHPSIRHATEPDRSSFDVTCHLEAPDDPLNRLRKVLLCSGEPPSLISWDQTGDSFQAIGSVRVYDALSDAIRLDETAPDVGVKLSELHTTDQDRPGGMYRDRLAT